MNKQYKIAVIGQGYVGLPLAIEFSKHFPVIGFDINEVRVAELNRGEDHHECYSKKIRRKRSSGSDPG